MKIRRITLGVLILLTVLFIADVRVFRVDDYVNKQHSVHFQIGPRTVSPKAQFKKVTTFSHSQGELTALVVKGRMGTIDLRSTDSPELTIHATVVSTDEAELETWDVEETTRNSEIRYELAGGESGVFQNIGVDYIVQVPQGMEVHIEQQFGEVNVEDFVGYLDVYTRFTNLTVQGLQGSVTVDNQFGDVNLQEIAGPLSLTDSYSTSNIHLMTIDGGYDFDVEVINGSLKHNAGFQVDIQPNHVRAHGQWGEGVHPVVIRSSFGTVTVQTNKISAIND